MKILKIDYYDVITNELYSVLGHHIEMEDDLQNTGPIASNQDNGEGSTRM